MIDANANFNFWLKEIADMPEKDVKGEWYDLEDGLPYDETFDYQKNQPRTRQQVSDKTKVARKEAKQFGASALKGSRAQVAWAEKIRAEVLKSINDSDTTAFLSVNSIFSSAKFWIESRNHAPQDFLKLKEIVLDLIHEANTLQRNAENELVMDANNIIISRGRYDMIMQARADIISKIDAIKMGSF